MTQIHFIRECCCLWDKTTCRSWCNTLNSNRNDSDSDSDREDSDDDRKDSDCNREDSDCKSIIERLTLYQYKNIFHKIFILLTHSILLKHLKLFTFLPSYLLIFLSSYLLIFVSFHHCTIWQSYNLTILFILFTTNFLDYSAWLLTSSPTTAKYFKKLFCCEYHTFCK